MTPAQLAASTIESVMAKGSSKDGSNEKWRDEDIMFHLSKSMAHLATHIRNQYDPRRKGDENELHLALTRLAMALTYQP